ncbi:hypothetical protein N9K85_03775 [Flavobacteriaceae bacterium]|nr:hypothetical protein [Flavobacteriaceae bacterium]MDB2632262.1 hypothetical protein [Flavobacteriaceae bacterium]
MKSINKIFSLFVIVATLWSCADDEKNVNLSDVQAPSALAMAFDVTQDNTGLVTITPTAEGAITFDIALGDDTPEAVEVENGQNTSHTYAEGTYTVTATAYGITGLSTSLSQELVISFQAPENLEVTIENDAAVSKQVNVTVNADYAITFDVYSGETGVTTPVSANIGETAIVQYSDAGIYDITIEVKGAAIQTTTYIEEDFEVTEILAPIAAAPTPPARQPQDVISIFSSAYSNVAGTNYFPDWGQGGQGSSWTMFDLAGDEMLQYINLSYQGIALADGTTVDVSNMEYLHLDVWTSENGDITDLETSIINNAGGTVTEAPVTTSLNAGQWTSLEIPISDYTDQGLTVSDIFQLKFVGTPWAAGTVFIDNIYFYKQPTNSTAQVINFEGGYTLSSFDGGDISVIANPDSNGNSSSNVAQMIKGAGQPWAGSKITLENPFDITNPVVTVKVWSPRVGLNLLMKFEDNVPWPNVTGSAEITATTTVANQWETLTFDHSGINNSIDWYNMVLIMDNGTQGDGSANYTIYLDDFTTSPALDFEPEFSELSSFDGGDISVIANPDTNGNTSGSVAQMIKGAGQPWAGSKITVPAPFNVNSTSTVTVKVWSPRVGLNLLMKFEDNVPWPNVTGSAEITATTTTANQWETLTFNHSGINDSIDWYNMVLIMDNGTQGDGSANYTIYLDDITIN